MKLTPEEEAELTELETAFEQAGGRGVEMADRIDHLRRKRDLPAIHRTKYTVTVLSRGPIPDDFTIGEIMEAMDEGDYVGTWSLPTVEALDDNQVFDALEEVGNDGHFFDDPDDYIYLEDQ